MSSNDSKDKILEAAYEIMIDKGVKSTTMDYIARHLQMSKRTLYEMFENKIDLLTQAMEFHYQKHHKICEEIVQSSPNLMEALVKIFKLHRDNLRRINIRFFQDMDRLHPTLRNDYETRHNKLRRQLNEMFDLGVKQGVFRNDINFSTLSRIIELQMESIIRMEDIFTGDLELTDVFDTITICYIRAIASSEGLKILESAIPLYFPELSVSSNSLANRE